MERISMSEAGRREPSRRIRIFERTCEALEKRMAELHRDHEDISPFVEWVLKMYLSGEINNTGQMGPAQRVTVDRIESDARRKTA
jgi:hypothetical protein